MLSFLLERSTVIGLAVVGGILSLIASWCSARKMLSAQSLYWINKLAYVFMGASMLLFVIAGLRQ